MDPHDYSRTVLKDLSPEALKGEIYRLQLEMDPLKSHMEHPEYPDPAAIQSEDGQKIRILREHLALARQMLNETEGGYNTPPAETRTVDFQQNLPLTQSIRFTIRYFPFGLIEHQVTLEENGLTAICIDQRFGRPCSRLQYDLYDTGGNPVTRSEFMNEPEHLHMEEWLHHSSPERFGMLILDGTTRDLEICYRNDPERFLVTGENSHPCNFDDLLSLIGIDHKDPFRY